MTEVSLQESFRHWARLGYVARGIVYLVIGGLALLTAFGEGGDTTDSQGAILTIFRQPFGQVLLWVMVVGLFGYSVWRFRQAYEDVDGHGRSAKGLAIRTGLFASAIIHLGLAVWTVELLLGQVLGQGGGSSGQGEEQARTLLSTDAGQLILGGLGLCVIAAGFAHLYKGWSGRFERYMDIPAGQRSWACPVCRFGLSARGFVWFIIGWFLLNSAMSAQQGDISGMRDALTALRDAAYGPWLLAIVAAGLFSFGVYSFLQALYRHIDAPG
jgi:hypothetical protein